MNKKQIFMTLFVVVVVLNVCATVGLYWKQSKQNENVKYSMYIGLNDKDTFTQVISTSEAMDIVQNVCNEYLDGFTVQDATGMWIDEKGIETHEKTIVCIINGSNLETVHKIADELIAKLNQNTILIETTVVDCDYYRGKIR